LLVRAIRAIRAIRACVIVAPRVAGATVSQNPAPSLAVYRPAARGANI
jgi:hypothetical protein